MQNLKNTHMPQTMFPYLGYGLGLRTPHYAHILDNKPDIDWFEIISENFMDTGGRPRRKLDAVRAHYPVVMHGVSLGIGTVDPLNSQYLQRLKALADEIDAPWVSDHLCWTGVAHKNTHDLLPVPYTEEALTHIIDRIKAVQDVLGQRLVLENPSTYLEFTASTMSEWEFIARMAEDSDCGLLLDVNNIYVSCYNHKWDPKTYIDALPLNRVAQIHLAGHDNQGTHIIDTHDGPVIDEVWALYRYVIDRAARPISTMVEWDDDIPDFETTLAEVNKARTVDAMALPTFQSFRDNVRVPEKAPSYAQSLTQMQNAILSGDPQDMAPDETIIPKPDYAPEDQILSYIKGYRYRLYDLVHDEYTALKAYLGGKDFADCIDAYIEATPSTHYSISRYIDLFADFVKARADTAAYELCVLETHISQLFDAPETDSLLPEHLQDVTPEDFMNMQLRPRTALVLFESRYPVNRFYSAVMQEKELPDMTPEPEYTAIYRHKDEMLRLSLEQDEYTLLSALFAGKTIGAALEEIDNAQDAAARLTQWFSRWMHNGLLAQ